MKPFFEFVKNNFAFIVSGVIVLALICAYLIPFIYGTSTLVWRWAMNPYIPC